MSGGNVPGRCDLCHTPIGVRKKKNKREFIRRAIDPISNTLLVMCNACGLRLSRAGWRNKKDPAKSTATIEKDVCLKEFEEFTKALCDILQDSDANKLCCPVVTPKLCQCIQRYIILGDIDRNKDVRPVIKDNLYEKINKEKAIELNELHKKAKQLIKMKAPKPINKDKLTTNEKRGVKNLRTKEYEQFVLLNREKLKKTCNLCERGVQRVLCYSNNYLHKQLKTSPNGEARIAGKSTEIAKVLPDIETLSEKKCCTQRCTRLAMTHGRLIERWRNKALLGQRDARAVLAEMLTPAGGAVNCPTFLHLVTGCSAGLLNKVKKELKHSSGVREPPEHGLREYWRRKKINAARNRDSNKSSNSVNNSGSVACTAVINKNPIDSIPNMDQTVQMRRPVILRSNYMKQNFESKIQTSNNIDDNFIISRTGVDSRQSNSILSIETTNNLSDSDVQNLFVGNIENGNSHQNNLLPLPVKSSDSVTSSVYNNDGNQISLFQPVLTLPVTDSTENAALLTANSDNGDDNEIEGHSEQQIQFIEITKLPSDTPLSREETVPVKSMIIITPGCLILNDSLILS